MHNGKYKCHTAASCTYHLSSHSCSTRAIQKAYLLSKTWRLFFYFFVGGGGQEKRPLAERTRGLTDH